MHRWFIAHIKKTGVPYIVVSGTPEERLSEAKKAAKKMMLAARKI